MRFDDLDNRMCVFETAHDTCVLPSIYIVARLDGRGFTRLTKEVHDFQRPFDVRFRDMMAATAKHLMQCGFQILYGFTESDEISLLFSRDERSFGRKTRKLNSVLAGEASGQFSLLLGDVACFDCRISQLPTPQLVVDYFRWRSEDAHRNALNAHCYWKLREVGKTPRAATSEIAGLSIAGKNELLFQHGVNFNDLPAWQKRGMGFFWEQYEKPSENPITGEQVTARRRKIRWEPELPIKDRYDDLLFGILQADTANEPQ